MALIEQWKVRYINAAANLIGLEVGHKSIIAKHVEHKTLIRLLENRI